MKERTEYLPKAETTFFGMPHLKSDAQKAFRKKTNGIANSYKAHPYIDERYDIASMNFYDRNKDRHMDTSADPFAFSHTHALTSGHILK